MAKALRKVKREGSKRAAARMSAREKAAREKVNARRREKRKAARVSITGRVNAAAVASAMVEIAMSTEPTPPFEIGDVVKLKSGGATMVVENVRQKRAGDGWSVDVAYSRISNAAGSVMLSDPSPERDTFDARMLHKVGDAGGCMVAA